ncbi:MAG: O-antigen ligase family protein [Oscillospiraceae bacterium]|nr:O-antigen ligase family protein [Oscillospiraceae bacterium]
MISSSILGTAYEIWLSSGTFAFLRMVFAAFSRSFSQSRIVHRLVRDSRAEPVYRASLFARIFKAVMDLMLRVIGAAARAVEKAARGSVTAAFINRFVKGSFFINFETLLGGFICLMFIIPHDYWSNTYALLAAAGLFALYILLAGAGKRKVYYLHDMGLPVLLFAIACAASLGFSPARADSLRVLTFYVTALLLFYVISADITSRERLMKLLGFVYFAVIIAALYAVYQRFAGVAVSESLTDLELNAGVPGRVYGTLGNPNNFAEFLVMLTPAAAVFAAKVRAGWLRIPLCAGIGLPFIALLMTYSRSCWISMMLACVIFVYYANKKLIPAFFLLCVAAIPLLPDSVMIRLSSMLSFEDSSGTFRIYIWMGTIKMVRDYFLTGIGLGPESFAVIYPEYADLRALVGAPHSHMVYMELIIELGVLGFVSFMWFMLRLWKDTARALLRTHGKTVKYTLIACISGLAGIAFAFGVEYVWYYPRTFFAYFVLAGITAAAIRLSKAGKNGNALSDEISDI